MLGGIDVTIKTTTGESAMEFVVRAVRNYWPNCIWEDPARGEFHHAFKDLAFGQITELFIYKCAEDAAKWDEHGATPELANTMIHVLRDPDCITLVVDSKIGEMSQILESIQDGLNSLLFQG